MYILTYFLCNKHPMGPIKQFIDHHICVCPKPEPGFSTSYDVMVFFYIHRVKVRGDCLFC